MSDRVVISGVGTVSALGIGIDANWQALIEGRSGVAALSAFESEGFESEVAGQVGDYKIGHYVPKTYRKATKVMARDIELAVIAADQAARDAQLRTKGTDPEGVKAEGDAFAPSYAPSRMGAHIGAGLIAADLDELTAALDESRGEDDQFDMHRWGREGMGQLTPLWLLKYLPNMLACHVTIVHDAQGPSNTITCAEASGTLSVGESLRVIQRDAADLCFCGGAESKLNPMAFLRQVLAGRLNSQDNDHPAQAVRPFCQTASGTVIGEGGGIVVLERLGTLKERGGRAYAEVVGFGASQSVHLARRNQAPDPQGRSVSLAIRRALAEAKVEPDQVDLIAPTGLGLLESDQAEAAGLRDVFGDRLKQVPLMPVTPYVGNCYAGAGAFSVAMAAKAVEAQHAPAVINTKQPLEGLLAGARDAQPTDIRHALVLTAGFGGQTAALVLRRCEDN